MEWVSIKDHVPDQNELCFVYGINGYNQKEFVNMCIYEDGEFVTADSYMDNYMTVTHWMRMEKPNI